MAHTIGKSPHSYYQVFNLVLGAVLLMLTLILNLPDKQMILLGGCALAAIIAGFSHNEQIVYIIDLLLGLTFISSF